MTFHEPSLCELVALVLARYRKRCLETTQLCAASLLPSRLTPLDVFSCHLTVRFLRSGEMGASFSLFDQSSFASSLSPSSPPAFRQPMRWHRGVLWLGALSFQLWTSKKNNEYMNAREGRGCMLRLHRFIHHPAFPCSLFSFSVCLADCSALSSTRARLSKLTTLSALFIACSSRFTSSSRSALRCGGGFARSLRARLTCARRVESSSLRKPNKKSYCCLNFEGS